MAPDQTIFRISSEGVIKISDLGFSDFNEGEVNTMSLMGLSMTKDKVSNTKYIVPSNLGNFLKLKTR